MNKENNLPTELCPVCGSRLPEGAQKCLVCGTDFTAKKNTKANAPTKAVQASRMPEITLSLPAALGFLTLFLGLGAVMVYFLVRQQPEIAVPPTVTPTASVTVTPSPSATPETPTPTGTPEPSPTPYTYRVALNDTCISIAFAFNVSVQSIILLNGLPASCNNLVENQVLLIPQPTPTGTPQPSATLNPEQATKAACSQIEYKVQEGNTLSTIAANYGIPMEAIKRWNGLVSDIVQTGQTLILPLCEQVLIGGNTPTPTIPPPYPAPNLLLPADGAAFLTSDKNVTLQWAAVGTLSSSEAYMVIVEDITGGESKRLTEYVTDTKLIVPDTFQPDSTTPHVIRWWVQTVRQSGTDELGQPTYQPAGAASAFRDFVWAGAGGTPSP